MRPPTVTRLRAATTHHARTEERIPNACDVNSSVVRRERDGRIPAAVLYARDATAGQHNPSPPIPSPRQKLSHHLGYLDAPTATHCLIHTHPQASQPSDDAQPRAPRVSTRLTPSQLSFPRLGLSSTVHFTVSHAFSSFPITSPQGAMASRRCLQISTTASPGVHCTSSPSAF